MKRDQLKKLIKEELQGLLKEYTIGDIDYDKEGRAYISIPNAPGTGLGFKRDYKRARRLLNAKTFRIEAKKMGYSYYDISVFMKVFDVANHFVQAIKVAQIGLKLAPYAKMMEELGFDYTSGGNDAHDALGGGWIWREVTKYDTICMFDAIKELGCFEDEGEPEAPEQSSYEISKREREKEEREKKDRIWI